jgi:hypothetical protein
MVKKSAEPAEPAARAYYPKTYSTRDNNWAWQKSAKNTFFLMKAGFLLHIISTNHKPHRLIFEVENACTSVSDFKDVLRKAFKGQVPYNM